MNFDKLIENMFKEGMTSEDIAKAFTTALNKRSEQEKATKKRDSVINDFKQVFISRIKEKQVSNADAAALSTVIASDSPEGKDWTAEQIDDFYKFTCDVLDSLPKQFNLFEKVHAHSESLTDFIETMESMITSVTKTDCGCGGNCHSKTEPCDDCKIHKPPPPPINDTPFYSSTQYSSSGSHILEKSSHSSIGFHPSSPMPQMPPFSQKGQSQPLTGQ